MPLSFPPTSGLVLHLAAWEPNGSQGAGLLSGGPMASWKNRGSGVADATQATAANQPTWKAAANRWPAVSFDSISDRFTLPSSAATLKFIHETGVFDMFVCARASKNAYGVIAGSAFNGGELGFLLERQANPEAYLQLYLFLGASGFRSHSTYGLGTPNRNFEAGVVNKMLFRSTGIGAQIQSSSGFVSFTSGGGTLPALPVGNATNDTTVGSYGAAQFYGGELLDFAIYNRNLSAGELTTMSTYFSERYGV